MLKLLGMKDYTIKTSAVCCLVPSVLDLAG